MASIVRARPRVAFYLDGRAAWLRYTRAGDRLFGLGLGPADRPEARIFEWDAATGRRTGPAFRPARGSFSGFAVSPDARWIASYGDGDGSPTDASLDVWDARTGEIVRRVPAVAGLHGTRTNHLAFVDRNLLFSYGVLRGDPLLDVATGRLANVGKPDARCGAPDAVGEDGSAFATLAADGRVTVCRTRDRRFVASAPSGVDVRETGFGYYAFTGASGLFAAQTESAGGASFVTWTSVPAGPHGTLGAYASGPRPQLAVDRGGTRIASLAGTYVRAIALGRGTGRAVESDLPIEDVPRDRAYGASMYLTSPPDFGAAFAPDGSRLAVSSATDTVVYDLRPRAAAPVVPATNPAIRAMLCRTANVPAAEVRRLAGPDAVCLRRPGAL